MIRTINIVNDYIMRGETIAIDEQTTAGSKGRVSFVGEIKSKTGVHEAEKLRSPCSRK